MKKYFFLISVAALAMTACTNESDEYVGSQESKEIAFAPLTQTATRAADTYASAIDGTTFPTDLNMYVAAYQVRPTTGSPASGINYFAGTQFTYNSTATSSLSTPVWSGATKRYWPLSPAYINFLAYANVTGSASFNGVDYASAAVVTQTDNSTAQTDLMYAIGHGEVTKTANALNFPDKVGMEFKHAQAWMDFYVKAKTTTETAITINSITLKGAKYSGTYTITHTNYDQESSQSVAGAWTSPGTQLDVEVPGWSTAALTTDFVHVGKGLLVVPDDNATTNDWTSFVINYTFDGKTYDFEYTAPAAPGATVAQAQHYIFNITFTLHEIFVAATVEDWTDNTTAVPVYEAP